MGDFKGFDHIDARQQRGGRLNWGIEPRITAEVLPFRFTATGQCEFPVFQRLKGVASVATPPACTTSFIGHDHLVGADDDLVDTVIRSLRFKLGYHLPADEAGWRIHPVGVFGAALNRSRMVIENGVLRLTILDEPEVPDNPFVAHIFAANVVGLIKPGASNGSLEEVGWFTVEDLVVRFGTDPRYLHSWFFFHCIRNYDQFRKVRDLRSAYPDWRPGVHALDLRNVTLLAQ